MRAVGYCRISKQAERGCSLEAQREKISAMCVVQGAGLAEVVIEDGESAKSLDRPALRRLLDMVDARQVDVVIVAKLDRLTRSVRDLAELLERFSRRGVSLVSVNEALDTGSASGRLVLNIMVSVSQWEREAIGERTRDALQHKRSRGERVGTVPYGYGLAPDGVQLQHDATEQVVLVIVRELQRSGCTVREIATELNARGHRTRRGTAWRHQYVSQLLKQPLVCLPLACNRSVA
jgi:site-specific DNA recombinase